MGIPGFYGSWVRTYVPTATNNKRRDDITSLNFASLAFDLNGLIHAVRQRIYGSEKDFDPIKVSRMRREEIAALENQFIEAVPLALMEAINSLQPANLGAPGVVGIQTLIVAVDGVIPAAKQLQQRQRRFRSKDQEGPVAYPFDRNAISPGTNFMVKLDHALRSFFENEKLRLPPKLFYSSHLVPGEGEHKIMELYRTQDLGTGNHAIYGLDADLILLTMLSPLQNIYLVRESVDSVLDIEELKRYVNQRLQTPQAIQDFVFLTMFLGNDFVPAQPSMRYLATGFEALLDLYVQGKHSFVQSDNSIDWKGVMNFLSQYGINSENNPTPTLESTLINQAAGTKTTYGSRFYYGLIDDQGKLDYDAFYNKWYITALAPLGSTDDVRDIAAFLEVPVESFFEVSDSMLVSMAKHYLTIIAWTMLYYTQGLAAVNPEYFYPYYYAPLIETVSSLSVDQLEPPVIQYRPSAVNEFTVLHQLVAVLPIASSELLPVELIPLMSYESPIYDIYPQKFEFHLDGKNEGEEHTGIAILPFIPRSLLYAAVAQYPFTSIEASAYVAQSLVYRELSPTQLEEQAAIFQREYRERQAYVPPQQVQPQRRSSRRNYNQRPGEGGSQRRYNQPAPPAPVSSNPPSTTPEAPIATSRILDVIAPLPSISGNRSGSAPPLPTTTGAPARSNLGAFRPIPSGQSTTATVPVSTTVVTNQPTSSVLPSGSIPPVGQLPATGITNRPPPPVFVTNRPPRATNPPSRSSSGSQPFVQL